MPRAILLACLLLLVAAPSAHGAEASIQLVGTVQETDGRNRVTVEVHRLVVLAHGDEVNHLDVFPGVGQAVVLRDDATPLVAGPGCAVQDDRVVCAPPVRPGATARLSGTAIGLGGGADRLELRSPAYSAIDPADIVEAGPGDDRARLTAANTTAENRAGAGADHISAEDGAQVRAGYGERTTAVRVTLDDLADDGEPGEGDRIAPSISGIVGGAGPDVLDAQASSKAPAPALRDGVVLVGAAGDDQLIGSPRNDRLEGSDGADVLLGGDGDDELEGGAGGDGLRGGAGSDLADYGQRTSPVSVQPGTGADDGERGEGDDVGVDVERLRGGAGRDDLRGGPGDDELDGAGGDDRLAGGPGDDRLLARDGNDVVDGGSGRDVVVLVPRTTLVLRDGSPDRLQCLGALRATAQLDDGDVLSPGCRPQLSLVSTGLRPGRDGLLRALVTCPVATLRCRAGLLLQRDARGGRAETLARTRDVVVPADGRRRHVVLRLTRAGRSVVRRTGRRGTRARLSIRSFGLTFSPSRAVRLLPRRG